MDIKGDIIVRDMDDEDAKRLQQKLKETHNSLPLYNSYLQESSEEACDYIVAFYKGALAGFAKLDWQSEYEDFKEQRIPEIKNLWVFEPYRKNGVAHQLMRALEYKAAKRSDYCAVGVGLSEDFEGAQVLFQKLGYEPDGKGVFYMGDEAMQDDLEVDDNQALMMIKRV